MAEGGCYDKMFIFISKFIHCILRQGLLRGDYVRGVTLMSAISAFMAETLDN